MTGYRCILGEVQPFPSV